MRSRSLAVLALLSSLPRALLAPPESSSSSRSSPPSLLLSETLAQPVRQAGVLASAQGPILASPPPLSPQPPLLLKTKLQLFRFFFLSRGGSGAGDKPALEKTPQRCPWQEGLRGHFGQTSWGKATSESETGRSSGKTEKGGGRALRRKPLLSSAGGSATHLPGLDPEGQDPIQQETQEVAKGCPGLALVPPRGEGSTRTSPASACGPGTLLRPAGLRSLALAHLAILFILDIICYFPQHGVRRPPKQSPVKSRLPPPPER